MNHTKSNSYLTHAGTGQRMHEDSAVVPTAWSADDANMVIWSLMQVLADAGVAGVDFDADTPGSYNRLSLAIKQLSSVAGDVKISAASAVQSGWLECDGSVRVRATYPALFAAIGTTYNTGGEAGTDFRLPDLRGEFVRGWDHGRGVDAGRAIGSGQLDALQNITGTLGAVNGGGEGASGAFVADGVPFNHISAGVVGTDASWTFDASRVARTAAETRPRNVAMMYVIKT